MMMVSLKGVRHKVLVYVTTEEAWEEDPSGAKELNEAYLNGIFVIVYLIEGKFTAFPLYGYIFLK